MTASPDISKQRLAALLASARQNRPVADEHADAPPFDWNQARHFNAAQVETLSALVSKIVAGFAADLGRLGHAEKIAVSAGALSQLTIEKTAASMQDSQFYISLAAGQTACGIIIIDLADACSLIFELLADTESKPQADYAFSPLELSLLRDMLTSAATHTARILKEAKAPELRAGSEISKGKPDLAVFGDDEFCLLPIAAKTSAAQAPIRILIRSSALDSAAGTASAATAVKKEDLQAAMMRHIGPARISIETYLAETTLHFKDVLSLTPNDILVFDNLISDSVKVIVSDRGGFAGRLGVHQDHYAIMIDGLQTTNHELRN